jgi:sugar lactone lactonase YvrE
VTTYLGKFVDNADVDAPRQLLFPRAAVFGSDGDLYVSGFDNNAIRRYNAFGGIKGTLANASNSPAFNEPTGLATRNGLIYVACAGLNQILRYDPTQPFADAFVDIFVNGGALNNLEGITFGPDGNLYVANRGSGQILRYNGQTGVFIGALNNGAGGLLEPLDLTFGPDGHLYVADPQLSGKVLRYNIGTGAFQDFFVNNDASLGSPRSVVFNEAGFLFVADLNGGEVLRYTSAGVASGIAAPTSSGGLETPVDLLIAEPCPDSDADGVPDAKDACPGTPADSLVESNGCPAAKTAIPVHWWGILGMAAFFASIYAQLRRRSAR